MSYSEKREEDLDEEKEEARKLPIIIIDTLGALAFYCLRGALSELLLELKDRIEAVCSNLGMNYS